MRWKHRGTIHRDASIEVGCAVSGEGVCVAVRRADAIEFRHETVQSPDRGGRHVVEALRTCVEACGVRGATIHSIMPDASAASLHVRLASMPAKEAKQAFRWQVAAALDADEADIVCASVPLGESQREYFVAGTT